MVANILVMALLIGLGAFELVDLFEHLLARVNWVLADVTTLVMRMFLSGALSVVFSDNPWSKTQFLIALGAFGSASIWHALVSGLRAWRDSCQAHVVTSLSRGRSRV